jgi:DNA-binding response OmpR family regulator
MANKVHQALDGRTIRILLVDDDDGLRRMTRLMLALEGFVVLEADNGRDALQLFEVARADVVIAGLDMADENGLEVIGRIGRYAPRVPIIAVSSRSRRDAASLRAAALLGADEVLEKPFSPHDLAATIRRVLAT